MLTEKKKIANREENESDTPSYLFCRSCPPVYFRDVL